MFQNYGDIKMCKKLKEISGVSADAILLSCGVDSYPVDIQRILKKLGIQYGEMDFSDIEEHFPELIGKRGEILGAVTIINDDVNIFYRQGSREHRKRFTLAHELAHCCLHASSLENKGHIEFRFDKDSENINERAANIFAGQLLMPKKLVEKMHAELIVPVSDVMAEEFEVSVPVMEARLEYLGLEFYSKSNNYDAVGEV